jgi:hypothetical protein
MRSTHRAIALAAFAVVMIGSGLARAAGDVFTPAFGPGDIDWTQTRQFIGGVAAEPDKAVVLKAPGFHPADANWDDNTWILGPIEDGNEHSYQYLIVLKSPAAVGTVCANAGDPDEYKPSKPALSRTNGTMSGSIVERGRGHGPGTDHDRQPADVGPLGGGGQGATAWGQARVRVPCAFACLSLGHCVPAPLMAE